MDVVVPRNAGALSAQPAQTVLHFGDNLVLLGRRERQAAGAGDNDDPHGHRTGQPLARGPDSRLGLRRPFGAARGFMVRRRALVAIPGFGLIRTVCFGIGVLGGEPKAEGAQSDRADLVEIGGRGLERERRGIADNLRFGDGLRDRWRRFVGHLTDYHARPIEMNHAPLVAGHLGAGGARRHLNARR